MNQDRKLARELQSIGVTKEEIAELTRAARRLGSLRVPGMSAAARQRIEARLPFDVEVVQQQSRRPFYALPRPQWAAVGAFAAVAILVGTAMLVHSPSAPTSDNQQKAHEVIQSPKADEEQIEQYVQELQQLQEQPAANKQELEKTKDNFRRSYEQYERSHSDNPWKDYRLQPWWTQTTKSDGKQTSSQKHSSNKSYPSDWRR